jgi:hypothetical protein
MAGYTFGETSQKKETPAWRMNPLCKVLNYVKPGG